MLSEFNNNKHRRQVFHLSRICRRSLSGFSLKLEQFPTGILLTSIRFAGGLYANIVHFISGSYRSKKVFMQFPLFVSLRSSFARTITVIRRGAFWDEFEAACDRNSVNLHRLANFFFLLLLLLLLLS